jgi:hypothetical protein
MPAIGLLMLLAQLGCAIHAGRTGRPFFWIYLVLFVPMLGMVAYFALEILPELAGSRTARKAASGVSRIIDPEKGYRAALREVQIASTTATKSNLAEQGLLTGRDDEAVALYEELLTGLHATDAGLMLGLARAHFARGDYAQTAAVLERLRAANPDYRSAEGHLLYARSLELQHKTDAALYEYAALAEYYPGQEAKSRYALLLKETGDLAAAKQLFAEVCQAIEFMPKHARRAQREWYDFAKRNMPA